MKGVLMLNREVNLIQIVQEFHCQSSVALQQLLLTHSQMMRGVIRNRLIHRTISSWM